MSYPAVLLPPNATALERAMSRTNGRLAPAAVVPSLWNPATCPESVLPLLAWALSVDEWDDLWSIEKKRAVVAAARALHQIKGTPQAIRTALASLGQPDAVLMERADCIRRDGSARRGGLHRRRGLDGWPSYRVILQRPVTVVQAHQIKRQLHAVQRNCVELLSIDYQQAALRRDGSVRRNGAYTRGTVNTSI